MRIKAIKAYGNKFIERQQSLLGWQRTLHFTIQHFSFYQPIYTVSSSSHLAQLLSLTQELEKRISRGISERKEEVDDGSLWREREWRNERLERKKDEWKGEVLKNHFLDVDVAYSDMFCHFRALHLSNYSHRRISPLIYWVMGPKPKCLGLILIVTCSLLRSLCETLSDS